MFSYHHEILLKRLNIQNNYIVISHKKWLTAKIARIRREP